MKVETSIKPSTRGVGSKPLPAPKSDFYQLADAAVVARSQGLAGTARGRLRLIQCQEKERWQMFQSAR